MKYKTLFIAAAVFVAISSAWTQTTPGYLKYLTDTANQIYELEKGSMEPKPDDLKRISTSACRTLERLASDQEFKRDLARFDEKRPKDMKLLTQIRSDLNAFIDSFAKPEAALLRSAGLSPKATSDILFSAAFFHDSPPSAADGAAILANIDRLRRDICSAAQAIENNQDNARTSEERRKRFRKWGFGIGGLTLIAVDITAAAESAGLSTASVAIGAQMFGASIKE